MTDGSAGIEKGKWRLTLSGRDSRSDGEQVPNPVYPEDQQAEKYYNTYFQLSNISLAASSRITDRLTAYLRTGDRKSTRLNSSHVATSYAVFCLKKKKKQ